MSACVQNLVNNSAGEYRRLNRINIINKIRGHRWLSLVVGEASAGTITMTYNGGRHVMFTSSGIERDEGGWV